MNNNIKGMEEQLPTAEEIEDIRNALAMSAYKSPDVDAEWERMSERIDADSMSSRRKIVSIFVGAVASIIIVFILATLNNRHTQNPHAVFVASNIPSDMTVQTGNAKPQVIKGNVLSFATTNSSTAGANDMVEVTMPRGKDCHITLPDGTKVWLNTDSKLTFPRQFVGARRSVKLYGEAFFDVAHDKVHPFTVETEGFSTTAIGTAFNVCAYSSGKPLSIALVEGEVAIKGNAETENHHLYAGQIATFSKEKDFNIAEIDTYPYTQRKDGFFYFDNEPLLDIMVELGRWYNKTIVFENENAMKLRLHFVAERSQSIQSIIESMNELDGVNIGMYDNEVTVK